MTKQPTATEIMNAILKTSGMTREAFAKLPYRDMVDHVITFKAEIPTIKSKKQGSNWINQWKRNGLHVRDGARCTYCGVLYTAPDMTKVDVLNPTTWGSVASTIDRRTDIGNCDGSFVLTLDHILPRIACATLIAAGFMDPKFMNSEANLATACKDCNDARNDQSVASFLETMATFNKLTGWTKAKAQGRITEIITGQRRLKRSDVRLIKAAIDSAKKRNKASCMLPADSQVNGIGYPKVMGRIRIMDLIDAKRR